MTGDRYLHPHWILTSLQPQTWVHLKPPPGSLPPYTNTHAPVQAAVGTTANVGHPCTVTTPPAISAWSNHPSNALVTLLSTLVNIVGTGIVISGPVFVYVSNKLTATSVLVIIAGGQGNSTDVAAGMEDGTEPVCQGRKSPEKRLIDTEREAHLPSAVRGSVGIQPCARPSW